MREEPLNYRGRTGKLRLQRGTDLTDLYLVEGLNQVRRQEEFAVKKKTSTTKDTSGNEGKAFKGTFSTQARRSTAMVHHEEPIRSS